MASLFFPPPTRLLSAAPPKYKAAAAAAASAGEDAPAPGSDEYLCVFCEHTLLYGNSASRRRKLVSKRKKMLARKQRARERASGVANGTKTFAAGNGGPSKHIRKIDQDDEDDDYDGDDWECDDEILPNGQCRCVSPMSPLPASVSTARADRPSSSFLLRAGAAPSGGPTSSTASTRRTRRCVALPCRCQHPAPA